MAFSSYAQNFEGRYDMHMEPVKKKNAIDMFVTIKGERSLMELRSAEGDVIFKNIFNAQAQSMTQLTEKGKDKLAMIRKMPDYSKLIEDEAGGTTITVTNESKVIDGFTCKKVIAESGKSISDMWVTDQTGLTYEDLYKTMKRSRGAGASQVAYLSLTKEINGIPLLIETREKKKPQDVTVVTIKNIRKETVSDDVFSISGYEVVDLRNMFDGVR